MAKFSDILSRASSSLWTYLGSDDPNNHSPSVPNAPRQRSLSSWSVNSAASSISSYYGRHGIQSERVDKTFNEGEIVYSKNNICVHAIDGEHMPGYFTIKVHKFLPFAEDGDPSEEATLILNWLPNNYIQAHPKSISPDASPSKTVTSVHYLEGPETQSFCNENRDSYQRKNSVVSTDSSDFVVSAIRKVSISGSEVPINSNSNTNDHLDSEKDNSSLQVERAPSHEVDEVNLITDKYTGTDATASEKNDDEKQSNQTFVTKESANDEINCKESAKKGKKHKKSLKKSQSVLEDGRERKSTSKQGSTSSKSICKTMEPLSVDLRQMKSLRLFFSDNEPVDQSKQYNLVEEDSRDSDSGSATGSLVIAARDGKFKVFHFHNGGLDKLVSVLAEWQFLKKKQKNPLDSSAVGYHKPPLRSLTSPFPLPGSAERTVPRERVSSESSDCGVHHFTVWRPPVIKQEECHIEEGIYSELDEETWRRRIIDADGLILSPLKLKRIIFFGGVAPSLRKTVWPFLLQRFSCDSTLEERLRQVVEDRKRYEEIDLRRKSMSAEEADLFWKKIECTVEKDAPRTDRTNPFFAGDDNENVHIMKRILLNYALYNPQIGYTQGMSDLLAPLLIHLRDESEAFWSFVGLMERTSFISSPKDSDMDHNLSLLRELVSLMHPRFYQHLASLTDGLELLFTHRWILLCFKREFPDSAAFKIWEAAWASYQTSHFHLFVALAIICIYGNEVIDQNMKADEILFYFSTLTLHMDGEMVLKKSRGLLYQLQSVQEIPCSLENLVRQDNNSPANQSVIHPLTCPHRQRTIDASHSASCFSENADEPFSSPPPQNSNDILTSDSFMSIPISKAFQSSISQDTTVV